MAAVKDFSTRGEPRYRSGSENRFGTASWESHLCFLSEASQAEAAACTDTTSVSAQVRRAVRGMLSSLLAHLVLFYQECGFSFRGLVP